MSVTKDGTTSESIGVCILASLVLCLIPNRSNIPDEIIIPVVAALVSKVAVGDWDPGYQWSVVDLVYWPVLLLTAYVTVKIIKTQP